jgi:hypothetical protein
VEKGKDDSEVLERHFRNLSWSACETINGDRSRTRSIESMEELEGTILLAFLLLWLVFKIEVSRCSYIGAVMSWS